MLESPGAWVGKVHSGCGPQVSSGPHQASIDWYVYLSRSICGECRRSSQGSQFQTMSLLIMRAAAAFKFLGEKVAIEKLGVT